MKYWSRYNILFESKRFGYFLYNALSNIMMELDKNYFQLLEDLSRNVKIIDNISDRDFVDLLKSKNILTDDETEQTALMKKKCQRNSILFESAYLNLTICPTLACNFRCSYCFENTHENTAVMNSTTMDKLIAFVNSFENAKHLSVSWYGGEPTLAFDIIKKLTERFKRLEKSYEDVGLVTNGYLLDEENIDQLNYLRIKTVQITLDGCASTHNRRRMLAGKRPTFNKIMANIDTLLNSSYEGKCIIRINIDKLNMQEYTRLRSVLLERHKGKKIDIYPGRVYSSISHSYDKSCNLCAKDWTNFITSLYYNNGIVPLDRFYPTKNAFNTCIANYHQGYVIGPEGELYKCWEDVGKSSMLIGNLHNEKPVINSELVARYIIGTDPFDDENCTTCSALPICGGGCVNKRLRAKYFEEEGLYFCSPLKDNLVKYLEAYYDTYRTREICSIALGIPTIASLDKGYRMVQLEERGDNKNN